MSIKHRYYLELQIWDIQDCYMKKDSGWSANADTVTNDLETELQFIRNNIDWESEWITEQKSTDEEITMFYCLMYLTSFSIIICGKYHRSYIVSFVIT